MNDLPSFLHVAATIEDGIFTFSVFDGYGPEYLLLTTQSPEVLGSSLLLEQQTPGGLRASLGIPYPPLEDNFPKPKNPAIHTATNPTTQPTTNQATRLSILISKLLEKP